MDALTTTFEIVFCPDNRDVRGQFMDALTTTFRLGDDLISIDCPDSDYLVSVPDKAKNREPIQFLQTPTMLSLGYIHFTTLSADDSPTFCGTAGYDSYDHHGASHVLVEFRALPLHLWTFKTVDHLLHPYCVVAEIHPHTASCIDLVMFRCFFWTDTPANVPSRITIKVRRRFRNAANMLAGGINLDMFTVLIRVIDNPTHMRLRPVELLPPIPPFRRADANAIVPHCFLQDTEVDADRFQELLQSLLLSQVDGAPPIKRADILNAMQEFLPTIRGLQVHPISFNTYIMHYHGNTAFASFRSNAISARQINLAGRTFNTAPWCTSYRAEETTLTKFVRLSIVGLPIGLLQGEIANQLLSPFALLEDSSIPEQVLTTEDRYSSLAWVDSVIDTPKYITVYITPRAYQTDYLHTGQTFMPLYVRHGSALVESA